MIEGLVSFGLNLNLQNDKGRTVLMEFILSDKNDQSIKYLLGGNLDIQGNRGDTALILAIKSKKYELAKKLVNCGANPKIENLKGESAISLFF